MIFFGELITSCQIVLQLMAFAEDFDHLSLQMGKMEHKQEPKLAVEALLSGKYVMAVLPTDFGKTIICESFVYR